MHRIIVLCLMFVGACATTRENNNEDADAVATDATRARLLAEGRMAVSERELVARNEKQTEKDNCVSLASTLREIADKLRRGTGSRHDKDELVAVRAQLAKLKCAGVETRGSATVVRSAQVAPMVQEPPPAKVVAIAKPAPAAVRPQPVVVRAPPETTQPCYLHAPPPGLPISRVFQFTNETDFALGLRVSGVPLQIVGMTADMPVMLPPGVPLTPSMLPPGQRCYWVPARIFGQWHIEAGAYERNPYNGKAQMVGRMSMPFVKNQITNHAVRIFLTRRMLD